MHDKIYKDDNKFNSTSDNLNFKVMIFHDNIDKLVC